MRASPPISLCHSSPVALFLLALTILFPSFARAQDNVDWRYYGNDLANTRFQDIDQITPRTLTS